MVSKRLGSSMMFWYKKWSNSRCKLQRFKASKMSLLCNVCLKHVSPTSCQFLGQIPLNWPLWLLAIVNGIIAQSITITCMFVGRPQTNDFSKKKKIPSCFSGFADVLNTCTLFKNYSKCLIWIFEMLALSTNFCPIKTDLSGNTVWLQASGF